MRYAAVGGHKDIIELLIEKGATGWDEEMYRAAEGGHLDIEKLIYIYIYIKELIFGTWE